MAWGYKRGDWVVVTSASWPLGPSAVPEITSRIGQLAQYDSPAAPWDESGVDTHWVLRGQSHWRVTGVRLATPEELAACQLDQLVGGGL